MNDHIQNVSTQTTQPTADHIDHHFILQQLASEASENHASLVAANLLWDTLSEELILPIEAQEPFYLGLSRFMTTQAMIIRGRPLEQVQTEVETYLPFLAQQLPALVPTLQISQQFIMNLTGDTNGLYNFTDALVDEEAMVAHLTGMQLQTPLSWYYILKAQALYLYEHYTDAAQMIMLSEQLIDSVQWQLQLVEHYFYHSLILTAIYPLATPAAQQYYWERLIANLEKLKEWGSDCPRNFQHKYLLVAAEMARLAQKDHQAMELYDEAIGSAREDGFIQNEALANELLAKFWFAKGKEKYAEVHLTEAYLGYQQWGAIGKIKHLEEEYSLWLKSGAASTASTTFAQSCAISAIYSPQMLDFQSALKACQAISSELVLGWLLEQLMYIMLENAGAERGLLILQEKGQLLIQAERIMEDNDTTILQSLPIDHAKAPNLSVAMVNHVAKTKKPMLLNDATQAGPFRNDPYVCQQQAKSVLCMPLLNQGKLSGILYLENNLMPNAFSPQRVDLLQLLCVQASISINNARLVEELEVALMDRDVALQERETALQEREAALIDREAALQRQVQLTEAYSRFVPSEFLRQLGKESMIDVQLGDHVQKEMSILFSDIRDFTAISEKMTPDQNFRFVNGYLSRMEPVINEHNGFIDKFIGDGIMALFPTNADDALRAAIAMCHRLRLYNITRQRPERLPIKIGIGLHTGLLMLGTVGGHNRMDGTVISDAVNLGSRLEQLTKQYGIELLITEQTYNRLEKPTEYAIREIDRVTVKGKSQPVTILEVFDGDLPKQIMLKKRTLADFKRGLRLYRQQKFGLAAKQFRQLSKTNPQDSVAQLYVTRCESVLQHGLRPKWSGVLALTTK